MSWTRVAVVVGALAACRADDGPTLVDRVDAALAPPALEQPLNPSGITGTSAVVDASVLQGPDQPANVEHGDPVVTVEVHRGELGALAPGVVVQSMTAAGVVVGQSVTGADGRAIGVVPPGGTVVAAVDGSVTSFVGVEDGDLLYVGNRPYSPAAVAGGRVIVPAGPPGTLWYGVSGPCAAGFSATPTVEVVFRQGCQPAPQDLIAFARTGFSAVYLLAPAAHVPQGTTLTLAGPWIPPAQLTVSIGGIPPGAIVNLSHDAMNGIGTFGGGSDRLSAAVGGVSTTTLPHPPPSGDSTGLGTSVHEGLVNAGRRLTDYRVGHVGQYAIADLQAELLPHVSNLVATAHGASWTIGPGRPHDGVRISFAVQAGGGPLWGWTVVAPAGTTSVALPPLPGWGNATEMVVTVTLIEASNITSGREFRARGLARYVYLFVDAPPGVLRESYAYVRL